LSERTDHLLESCLNGCQTTSTAELEYGLTHLPMFEHASEPWPLVFQVPVGNEVGYQKVEKRIVRR
jgi:hypothetical protein